MTVPDPRAVVIGVGNEFRRDDGVGPAVLARLTRLAPDGVRLTSCDGEATQLLDAWAGAPLAIVVDTVRCEPPRPGRIHRSELDTELQVGATTTHGLGVPEAVGLAWALDLAPRRLVVYAVEAGDVGFGVGLTERVRLAVPRVVRQVLDELAGRSGQD